MPRTDPKPRTGKVEPGAASAPGPHEMPDDEVLGKAYDTRLMRRLWTIARPHRALVGAALGLFPLVAAVELCQPYLVKIAIDDHILKGDWPGVGRMAALFFLSLMVLYGLRAVQAYVMQLTGQRVMYDLRHAMFAHLQRLDAAFFARNPVGRLMTRVLNDVEAINELFVAGVVVVIGDIVMLVGLVVIMLGMNWRLALVTFALVPVLVVAGLYFRLKARQSYRRVRARLARLNAFLQEAIQGVTVIQLLAREPAEARIFAGLNGDLRAAQFRSTLFEASFYAAVEAIGSAAVALLLWYGGGEVVSGALTFGGLVAFLEYTGRFFLPIRDLGAKYAVMQAAMVSSERIFGLLDTEPTITSPRHAGGSAGAISGPPQMDTDGARVPSRAAGHGAGAGARVPSRPAVELRNVWFAYEGEQWVLRDCSLTIGADETVAMVGVTGEGKTTVSRLLGRTFDVNRGQVLVDGVDVREWDLTALRRHVGLVPQEVFLFGGSVRDNLTLGADARVTPAEVDEAVTLANVERLVRSLPHGLDEEIRERGANLSQGQRQLLAIARALIYNPRVLVLDEATSSIDPESEALLRSAMERLVRGRASLIIAHRLSTIQSADRILVLDRGRVREAGRHAELLAVGGLYARLHERQFRPEIR
ncbi:MAG TPA: ABC transporter ATP-binding protein [Candidatus Limnocylindrales bacterium]|nr:ABC transporter ATP-binding protein [Candidatus Limnocylindrales bacterium]